MVVRFVVFLLSLILLSSCMPSKEDDFKIITSGIDNIPEFSIDKGNDLGYIKLGSDPVVITITLYNNSEFVYKGMDVLLDPVESAGMTFVEDPDENTKFYPGYGGTCETELASHSQCTVVIEYKPNLEGTFSQKITWNYINLLVPAQMVQYIDLITAIPASLTFTADESFYDFGVIERTDITTERVQVIEVKNAGGLPAAAINISLLNTSTDLSSLSYEIIDNNCPEILFRDETCAVTIKYVPQNYQGIDYATAPDGDSRLLNYTSNLTFDYETDLEHTDASLNANFVFLSTGIEGYIEFVGLPLISFTDQVVGNEETLTVSLSNTGYKDSIVHKIHISHGDPRLHFAECIYRESNDYGKRYLTCLDAGTQAVLSLDEFPFLIKDNQNCFTEEQKLNYTRNEDTSLSDLTLRLIPGKNISDPLSLGETCTFDITFHPSVKYINGFPENKGKTFWNSLGLSLEYDSTWKNKIAMYNQVGSIDTMFEIEQAEYKYAALLHSDGRVKLNNNSISDIFPAGLSTAFYQEEFLLSTMPSPLDPMSHVRFMFADLGEVPLISSVLTTAEKLQYKQRIAWKLINKGESTAEAIYFQTFADSSAVTPITLVDGTFINDNFAVASNGCSDLPFGGGCGIDFDFLPQSGLAKEKIFDHIEDYSSTGNPYGYRRVAAYYTDGATFEDERDVDGNFLPRELQVFELRMIGELVSKGLLTFYDSSDAGDWELDETKTLSSGNWTYHDIRLRNIGTGGIVDLVVIPNISDAEDITSIGPASRPYTFIPYTDDPSKDCLSVIDGVSTLLPGAPVFGNNSSVSIPADGVMCYLRIKVELPRVSDLLYIESSYDNLYTEYGRTNLREKSSSERLDWMGFPNGVQAGGQNLGFLYKSAPTDLSFRKILSSNRQGTYKISSLFTQNPRLMVTTPYPSLTALVYKPPFIVDETDGGGAVYTTKSALWFTGGSAFPPVQPNPAFITRPVLPVAQRFTHFNHMITSGGSTELNTFAGSPTTILDSTNYEYLVYGGVFVTGDTNRISFSLYTQTAVQIEPIDIQFDSTRDSSRFIEVAGGNISDTPPVEGYFVGALLQMGIDFTSAAAGIFYQDINIIYTDGQFVDGYSGALKEHNMTIRVVAEAIDAIDTTPVEILIANVPVEPGDNGNPGIADTSALVYESYDWINMPNIIFEDVKGGEELFVQKSVRVKNPDAAVLHVEDMAFVFAKGTGQYTLSGFSVSDAVCTGTSTPSEILPGELCDYTVKYVAPLGVSVNSVDYNLTITTLLTPKGINNEKVYKAYQIPLYMRSLDPAVLVISGASLRDMGSDIDVNMLDLGSFSTSHIILDNADGTTKTVVRSIDNGGSSKASMLRQYIAYREALGEFAPHALPSTISTLIYDKIDGDDVFDQDVSIYANKPCFYGSYDETSTVDTHGFDPTTAICQLTFEFHALPEKYLGQDSIDIDRISHLIKLRYYNYTTISEAFLKLSFEGVVEPPRSQSMAIYTNVKAVHDGAITGTVEFTVENDAMITASTIGLGAIVGYRVVITGVKNNLYDIYSQDLAEFVPGSFSPSLTYFKDYTDLNNVVFTGLPENTFYYIKILPKRFFNKNGVNYFYFSHNVSQLSPNLLTIVVPGEGASYSYEYNVIVDTELGSEDVCFKDECKTICAQQNVLYYKDGGALPLVKQLITREIMDNYIRSDIFYADYNQSIITTYEQERYVHWLADNPIDISGEGFSSLAEDSDVDDELDPTKLYIKCIPNPDNGVTCEAPFPNLSAMFGYSQDLKMPPNTYFFLDKSIYPAYSRCFIEL